MTAVRLLAVFCCFMVFSCLSSAAGAVAMLPNPYVVGGQPSAVDSNGYTTYSYNVFGSLNDNEKLTLTLVAQNVGADFVLDANGDLGGETFSTSLTSSGVYDAGTQTLTSSFVLANTGGGGTKSFLVQYFAKLVALAGVDIQMSAAISSVPLPGALVLFAGGLAGLGFAGASRRRERLEKP